MKDRIFKDDDLERRRREALEWQEPPTSPIDIEAERQAQEQLARAEDEAFDRIVDWGESV